jgi:hypothetical protein
MDNSPPSDRDETASTAWRPQAIGIERKHRVPDVF